MTDRYCGPEDSEKAVIACYKRTFLCRKQCKLNYIRSMLCASYYLLCRCWDC